MEFHLRTPAVVARGRFNPSGASAGKAQAACLPAVHVALTEVSLLTKCKH